MRVDTTDGPVAIPVGFVKSSQDLLPDLSSQVKIYSSRYIEQCAGVPPCPVRGVVRWKRCSSSVN